MHTPQTLTRQPRPYQDDLYVGHPCINPTARPHSAWFGLHLCGRLDQFSTEKVYFYVYVRYESWFNQCPYPPFPFPTYYPDTGTGSEDSNRTLVGPLAQPLSKQTSQRLTRLHILSPASESHLPLILSYVPPCRPLRPSPEKYADMRQAHDNHHHLSCPASARD